MTVSSSSSSITFAGDGVQIFFDLNFKVFCEEDLKAVIRDSSGVERELKPESEFSMVSGAGEDSGGKVRYPVSGLPLSEGETITFYRNIPYSQELELVDNDPFSADLLNEAFDRGVMCDQQLQEQVSRALKYDISTPAEEQLSPQEFMHEIITSREEMEVTKNKSEFAANQAETAQAAAKAAQSGAEAAKAVACAARDEATKIVFGDIEIFRSKTPVLSGPTTTFERTTIIIEVTDHVEDGFTGYEIIAPDFGSKPVIIAGSISWTLGEVESETDYSLSVVRRREGEFYSETATHTVTVIDVPIQDGPTMVFTDSAAGYPGANVAGGKVSVPAHSVGLNNQRQITSAKMEIVRADSQIIVSAGTTKDVLKTPNSVAENEKLITDLGPVTAGAVEVDGMSCFSGNIIPTMTGETTEGCTITQTGPSLESTWPAWRLGDKNITGYNGAYSTTSSGTFYIAFANKCYFVREYRFSASSSVNGFPRNWTLSGEVNNEWVELDTKINQPSWTTGETRSFSIATPVVTNNFKLVISNADKNHYLGLSEIELIADERECSIDISSAGFTSPPTKVFKPRTVAMKLGAGATGEYLGPREVLGLGEGSTVASIKLTSLESIKDKIFIPGGMHNSLECDGQVVEVESVSETVSESAQSNLLPKMTGPTHETFTVTASQEHSTYPAWQVSSQSSANVVWYAGSINFPIWLKIEFPSIFKVCKYRLYTRATYPSRAPKNWLIKDANENVVDTQTGQISWTSSWREYVLPSPIFMSAFKLEISSLVSGADFELSEIEIIGRTQSYTTTVNLKNPLSQVPETVVIPDRCILSPTDYTSVISGDNLKVTAEEIDLSDNESIKRLAMSVNGENNEKFNSGKIYIKEKVS